MNISENYKCSPNEATFEKYYLLRQKHPLDHVTIFVQDGASPCHSGWLQIYYYVAHSCVIPQTHNPPA